MPPPRVLVTGTPGSGKTTLVRRVVERLPEIRAAGFYTEEVRGPAGRTGFRIVRLDGASAPLATLGSHGGPTVGRYVVHLAELEAMAIPSLSPGPDLDLLVVDEIGKMECLSPAFVAAMRRVLAEPVPLLGSVARAGGGFIAEAKRTPGVEVVPLTAANRDWLAAEIASRLEAYLAGRR